MGTRLGSRDPKALVPVAGRTILAHSLDLVAGLPDVAGVAVTAPADHLDRFRDIVEAAELSCPSRVTPGGDTRQQSVRAGLEALADLSGTRSRDADAIVLIHDAARCLTPIDQALRVIDAVAAGCDAVTPALPVVDTITQAGPARTLHGEGGPVEVEEAGATLDRSRLRAVQTPQGFPGHLIWAAHTAPETDAAATDDIQMVVAAGGTAALVAGDPLAFKITVPLDLDRAHTILTARA
ncbi:2-C-methyl-D-erythritol 4-phosphate cytidylyltransferase [Nanchangia anserum]|uniref:2-C-methyl-D-erythritol 4-phosphate cytidylyltransferase n=2 Tax=Nanchangia anserum TaxID=2692125 RepID=A0A8I0KUA3_9ACTO|nr:2-C-methyl-D-erythritol 4-phosphate cytidylyltransferase [Nanchangia anserum]QOX82657.1 2-C-methyl-D-erythritol 4-phosphate cytidylyltransferase [Nanchangia anserum]